MRVDPASSDHSAQAGANVAASNAIPSGASDPVYGMSARTLVGSVALTAMKPNGGWSKPGPWYASHTTPFATAMPWLHLEFGTVHEPSTFPLVSTWNRVVPPSSLSHSVPSEESYARPSM